MPSGNRALAGRWICCHHQAVINLSKAASRVDALLDLMGPVFGAMMLTLGLDTYRGGGSVGWPIAGAAVLLTNLYVAWRRFTRRRRTTGPAGGTPPG
jgi:hypothetical protein